ncbi:9968_t:CDS:2 [Gigaspora margarita]|uniref:9968_t:CDS:1 n=1 Tax=Gigaspora margarita TaxID=4874 RepID=A0ABN7U0Y3_GIGMA|nr:9968_t:CDS:2 [Gigaspora margarita]
MSNNISEIDDCSVSSSINNKSNSGERNTSQYEITFGPQYKQNIIMKDLKHNLNRRQAKVIEIWTLKHRIALTKKS